MKKEDKKKLLLLLKEKKERELVYYEPFEYQRKVHECTKKFRVFTAGNKTGKTYSLMREALWWALDCHPYLELPKIKKTILIIGVTMEETDQSLWQQNLMQWIPESKVSKIKRSGTYISEIHFKNGNVLIFKSYERGREKLQSINAHLVVMDEQPPVDCYEELVERVSATKGRLLLGFTPLKVDLELKRRLEALPPSEVEFFKFSKYECPLYTKEEIDIQVEGMHSSAVRPRVFGDWASWSGRLLPAFNMEKNTCKPFKIPDTWRKAITVDPATSGESAVCWLAEKPYSKEWIIYRTRFYSNIAPSELIQAIEEATEESRQEFVIRVYDSQAAWFRAEYKKMYSAQIWTPINKFKNNENMVNLLNQDFFDGNIVLFFTEHKAIEQIVNYSNRENTEEFSPIKKDDHLPDCLKYFVWVKPSAKQFPEVLDETARKWKWIEKNLLNKKLEPHPTLGSHY